MRAFPNHYKPDSIYAHYPMTIPSENRKIMTDLGREQDYSYDPPQYTPPRINLQTHQNVKQILDNPKDFGYAWSSAMEKLFGKGEYDAKHREAMGKALGTEEFSNLVKKFYEDTTVRLLQEKSAKLAGINQVDITRE